MSWNPWVIVTPSTSEPGRIGAVAVDEASCPRFVRSADAPRRTSASPPRSRRRLRYRFRAARRWSRRPTRARRRRPGWWRSRRARSRGSRETSHFVHALLSRLTELAAARSCVGAAGARIARPLRAPAGAAPGARASATGRIGARGLTTGGVGACAAELPSSSPTRDPARRQQEYRHRDEPRRHRAAIRKASATLHRRCSRPHPPRGGAAPPIGVGAVVHEPHLPIARFKPKDSPPLGEQTTGEPRRHSDPDRGAGKVEAEGFVATRPLGTMCIVVLLGAGCAETTPEPQTASPGASTAQSEGWYPHHRPRPYLIPPGGGKRRWKPHRRLTCEACAALPRADRAPASGRPPP